MLVELMESGRYVNYRKIDIDEAYLASLNEQFHKQTDSQYEINFSDIRAVLNGEECVHLDTCYTFYDPDCYIDYKMTLSSWINDIVQEDAWNEEPYCSDYDCFDSYFEFYED